jgi:hypothetical protein
LRLPQSSKSTEAGTVQPALHCAASLVDALGDLALPYISDLINDMVLAELSNYLIMCLQSIAECVPAQQNEIEDRMLQGVSMCLAGRSNVYDPLASFKASVLAGGSQLAQRNSPDRQESLVVLDDFVYDPMSGGMHALADAGTEYPCVTIDMADSPNSVKALVLGLKTLASFGGTIGKVSTSGGMVPLLPFVQDVAGYIRRMKSAKRQR